MNVCMRLLGFSTSNKVENHCSAQFICSLESSFESLFKMGTRSFLFHNSSMTSVSIMAHIVMFCLLKAINAAIEEVMSLHV